MSISIKRNPKKAFIWYLYISPDNPPYITGAQIKKVEENIKSSDMFDVIKHGDVIKNKAQSIHYGYFVFFIYKKDGDFFLCRPDCSNPNNNHIVGDYNPSVFFSIGEEYPVGYWSDMKWDMGTDPIQAKILKSIDANDFKEYRTTVEEGAEEDVTTYVKLKWGILEFKAYKEEVLKYISELKDTATVYFTRNQMDKILYNWLDYSTTAVEFIKKSKK
jgi:hypothetical protein